MKLTSKRIYLLSLLIAFLAMGPCDIPMFATETGAAVEGEIPAPAGTVIRGTVRDSLTNEPLPYVNIYVNASQGGTITDDHGRFEFRTSKGVGKITVSCHGYTSKVVEVTPRNAQKLKILLTPADYALQEVVIKPKKQKYTKKNNPAVEFMQKIREAAPHHDPAREQWYSFDKQEKIVMGVSDYDSVAAAPNGQEKQNAYINDYIEKSHASGRNVLKISVRERRTSEIFGSDPKIHKEYTSAVRSVGIDKSLNQANIQLFLNDLVRDIDVYKPDITLIQNRFVSPLSPLSADYYRFYMDTVMLRGERCVELTFVPRTPESMSFNGKLYVPVNDTTYTIRRVEMRAPKDINLNYVRDLYLSQEFDLDEQGNRRKVNDEVSVDMRIVPAGPALYIEKVSVYDNHSYVYRDDLKKIYSKPGDEHRAFDADLAPASLWEENRLIPLSKPEQEMGSLLSKMRRNLWFAIPEKIVSWLVNGYICTSKTNSKFDFGPVTNFVSHNTAEGWRLRIGGITTANLSPHWLARGYVAYGIGDKKLKYMGEAEYSFNPRKYQSREFPMHAIRVMYLYDLDQMGQRYGWQSDNLLTSIKRRQNYKVTYRRWGQLQYVLELTNHLSFDLSLNNEQQIATRWLPFLLPDGTPLKSYRQSWVSAEVRWAPGEKFIQGNTNRTHVNLDAPIFTIKHEYGPKKFLGSRYNLNITTLSAKKRFWFSSFGYADVKLAGAKVWSAVDYPSLPWPQANLSYTIQEGTFSLMNPMEFAVDTYASWDLSYCGNGILFNRIPLLKKLRLREILGFKGIFGWLTKRNNPAYNRELFPFPEDAHVSTLDPGTPYMECSAGIDNILTLFRVDYVWRLNYRHLPGIDRWGIRFGIHFAF